MITALWSTNAELSLTFVGCSCYHLFYTHFIITTIFPPVPNHEISYLRDKLYGQNLWFWALSLLLTIDHRPWQPWGTDLILSLFLLATSTMTNSFLCFLLDLASPQRRRVCPAWILLTNSWIWRLLILWPMCTRQLCTNYWISSRTSYIYHKANGLQWFTGITHTSSVHITHW